jgi:hypothetical protein
MCYNGYYKKMQFREDEQNLKVTESSDYSLKLMNVKLELLVIV